LKTKIINHAKIVMLFLLGYSTAQADYVADLNTAMTNWNTLYGTNVTMNSWSEVGTISNTNERDSIVGVLTDTSTVYVVTGNPMVPDSVTAVSINLAHDTLLTQWNTMVDTLVEIGQTIISIQWQFNATGTTFNSTTVCTSDSIVFDPMLSTIVIIDNNGGNDLSKVTSGGFDIQWIWGGQRGRIWWSVTCVGAPPPVCSSDCGGWMILGEADCKCMEVPVAGNNCKIQYGWAWRTPTGSIKITWNAAKGKFDVSVTGLGSSGKGNGSEVDACVVVNACLDEDYATDEVYGVYHAGGTLIVDGTVPTGNTAELKAEQTVILEQGFTMEEETELSISIEDCIAEVLGDCWRCDENNVTVESVHPNVSQDWCNQLGGIYTWTPGQNFNIGDPCPGGFSPFCGEIHNQVMDAVHQSLIFAVENGLTEAEILDVTYQTTINTLAELSGNSPPAIESTLATIGFPNYFPSFEEDSTLIEDLYAAEIAALDDMQLKNDLENLVLMIDEAENYEQFSNYLFNLEQAYQGTPHEDFIMAVVDVAAHSYQYWENNIDNWMLFGTATLKNPNTAKRVITGDVVGAIRGGISGSAAPGVGTLAGVCIGAPFGSAATGIWVALGW